MLFVEILLAVMLGAADNVDDENESLFDFIARILQYCLTRDVLFIRVKTIVKIQFILFTD